MARAGAKRLQGRRVLVVGAGQRRTVDETPPVGNGRAMSVLFAREGAAVACADLDLASAEETAAWARREGGLAYALQADVSRPEDIERLVREAVQRLGGLDGLVMNVGIGNHSRFGTETATFHVCARCGGVPVVTSETAQGPVAVVNVKTLDALDPALLRVAPVSFEGEDAEARVARRARNWIASVRFEGGEV